MQTTHLLLALICCLFVGTCMAVTQAPYYTINTVAGNGNAGYSGDNGQAISASLHNPYSACVSPNGDVFITDSVNDAIRKVSPWTGIITTLTNAIIYPISCTVNSNGDIFVSNMSHVAKIAASDRSISYLINEDKVYGVFVTSNNDLYYSDGRSMVKKLASGTTIPIIVAGNGTIGYGGDGGLATNAMLRTPWGVFVTPNGDLYIADVLNFRIRKVSASSGLITTVAGTGSSGSGADGVAATTSSLNFPYGVYVSSGGNIYLTDRSYRTRRVSTDGMISTIAGNGTLGWSGDGGLATNAMVDVSFGVTVDTNGKIFLPGMSTNTVRVLTPKCNGQLIYSPVVDACIEQTIVVKNSTIATNSNKTNSATTNSLDFTIGLMLVVFTLYQVW